MNATILNFVVLAHRPLCDVLVTKRAGKSSSLQVLKLLHLILILILSVNECSCVSTAENLMIQKANKPKFYLNPRNQYCNSKQAVSSKTGAIQEIRIVFYEKRFNLEINCILV